MPQIPAVVVSLVREVVEKSWARRVRSAITLKEARAEQRFVNGQAEKSGVKAFQPNSFESMLESKKQADTLFVMGSGESIRNLSSVNFEEIRSQRSVGINNWGIHRFVPDFYALESVPWVGDGKDFARALGLLSREDIVGARPPLLVLRPPTGRQLPELATLPSPLADRVFYYGRVSPSTRRVSNLGQDAKSILAPLIAAHPGVFLDSGASVVRMVGVALSLGLTRVVLTGVDLTHTDYFWENNPEYDLSTLRDMPVNNQKGYWSEKSSSGQHETMNTTIRPFSVSEMLAALSPVLLQHFGLTLFVSSPQSGLAGFLPIFDWSQK